MASLTHPNLIERLKPCPFCGGEAEEFAEHDNRIEPLVVGASHNIDVFVDNTYYGVGCPKCDVRQTNPFIEREYAIEAWNTRTNDQAISTLTAEVEAWKQIAGDFAGAAERCAEPPHYIVQPFLGLFKKYGAQLATLTKGSSILTQREPHD